MPDYALYFRVLQKFLKQHATPKFLGHVQLLMMMQEVRKLDILKNLFIVDRCIVRTKALCDNCKITGLKAENLHSYRVLPFLF